MIHKVDRQPVWSPTACPAEIGARLQGLRRGRRLSLVDLHQLTGIAYHSLHAYESGGRLPCTRNLVRLASLFGVSIDFLLFGWPHTKWQKFLKRPGGARGEQAWVRRQPAPAGCDSGVSPSSRGGVRDTAPPRRMRGNH